MVWIKDTMLKFTLPGGLVVDFYIGTFSVAKVRMLLPQHRRFVSHDLDSKSVSCSLS